MKNGKVEKFNISSRTEKCAPSLSGARTLCYNQVLTANTFMENGKSKDLALPLTLTVKMNTLFMQWKAYYARYNMSEKQRQHITYNNSHNIWD